MDDTGYRIGQSTVPAWWCERAYHWLADLARKWGHSGDAELPEGFALDRLTWNREIFRAVCDVLGVAPGPSAPALVHTHWHANAPHSDGLGCVPHQDNYWPHGRTDCVRVWWFPQAVTPCNGPIWVAPGSQQAESPPDPQGAVPILVQAGGFVVVAGGICQCQMPNGTDDPRIMVRLEFAPELRDEVGHDPARQPEVGERGGARPALEDAGGEQTGQQE